MAMELRAIIDTLNSSSTVVEKESQLWKIAQMLGNKEVRGQYYEVLKSSDLFLIIANLMKENNNKWAKDLPGWARNIVLFVYMELQWDIPQPQTTALVQVIKEYLTIIEANFVIRMLRCIARPQENKIMLLADTDFLKKAVSNTNPEVAGAALLFFLTVTDNCTQWQLRILEDEKFIQELLSIPSRDETWALFATVSQHPDAKLMMPKEVIQKAGTETFDPCKDVCAILSSESNATFLILDAKYIETRAGHLDYLLKMRTQTGKYFRYSLLEIILPLVNLSVADANKDIIGRLVIKSLLQVISIKPSPDLISNIKICLQRSKQEAAKALWDLAFWPENRTRILQADGKTILEHELGTEDEILKENILGILYMLAHNIELVEEIADVQNLTINTPQTNQTQKSERTKGHIMISYNWGNQDTVINIAKSLRDNGYHVWLDIDHMQGSTLEAMALAVEKADIVLMCMSQKYKDSPNCRLEGEYCVNRRVAFIPLLMEKNYQPDGWLGLALGAKLYHDFAETKEWEFKMQSLTKEIGNRGKVKEITLGETSSSISISPSSVVVPTAQNWTNEDILAWMTTEKIETQYETFIQHKFDGRSLLELKTLLLSPQNNIPSFFAFFFDRLNITDVGEMLRITAALRNLN